MKLKISMLINLVLVTILFACSMAFAANPNVQINGKTIDFTDNEGNKVEAQIINNRTMVPLRKIFEVLNCTVDWDNDSQMVTATKDSKTIVLQIGNSEAKLKDSSTNQDDTIILDSAPVIVNNRTLVPFRFIGESLDMEVAWDSSANTAIIIDYDSFAQKIKEKSDFLYKTLNGDMQNVSLTIEKKYFDEANSNNNSDIKITFYPDLSTDTNTILIDGTGELVNEIKNEEWNEITYTELISGDKVMISTPNYAFSNMLGIPKNTMAELDDRFNMLTSGSVSLGETIKNLIVEDDQQINAQTYETLMNDWNLFVNNFVSQGSKKLEFKDFEYNSLNVAEIFDISTNSSSVNSALLLNKAVFRYSPNFKDILIDYPEITYNYTTSDNRCSVKINMSNEYKERIEYEFVLQGR